MECICFQALFSKEKDFLDFINKNLLKASEENGNSIDKENINNYSQLNYVKKLSNHRDLIGFKILLDDSISLEVIKLFCEYLDDDEDCEFLIKFIDQQLFESLQNYYKEIFDIEMKLREILSFIFISTYENDCYSFLEFQKQKINAIYKNVKEDEISAVLKKKYQNEFFYLTFNQYRQLKLPDIVKSETLLDLLADSKSFEELKKNILNLGAMKSEKNDYLEFLNRISENLESIETVRNCVAHNREPTREELDNYSIAKEKMENELDEFFRRIYSACPKCGGEIEATNKYGSFDSDGQPSKVHLKVQCKACGEIFTDEVIDI